MPGISILRSRRCVTTLLTMSIFEIPLTANLDVIWVSMTPIRGKAVNGDIRDVRGSKCRCTWMDSDCYDVLVTIPLRKFVGVEEISLVDALEGGEGAH
jgi:hypothetical protein